MGETQQNELVIVPSDGDGFVELARTKQGRLFRKHILNKGALIHPVTKKTISIDDGFVSTLKDNFTNGVCDIVQVPLAGPNNEHTEAPDRNIGEVIGIEENAGKVYALIDAREAQYADKLGKTLLGASAMLHLDYTDTKTGKKVGPTLLHTCVTNRPYVTGLEDYQEVVSATSDTSTGAVLLSPDTLTTDADTLGQTTGSVDTPAPVEGETKMPDDVATATEPTREELLAALKDKHGIDVPALQAQAESTETAASLSKTLLDALTEAGVVKLANTDAATVSNEDVVSAVAELAQNNVALTNKVNGLERLAAQTAVDALIAEGKVLPKQRKAMVELKLSAPGMFDELVPAEPVVKLNHEKGADEPDDSQHNLNIDEEVARLSNMLNKSASK